MYSSLSGEDKALFFCFLQTLYYYYFFFFGTWGTGAKILPTVALLCSGPRSSGTPRDRAEVKSRLKVPDPALPQRTVPPEMPMIRQSVAFIRGSPPHRMVEVTAGILSRMA